MPEEVASVGIAPAPKEVPGRPKPPCTPSGGLAQARTGGLKEIKAQTFMALDFGTRRTGVAYGNRLLRSAQPLATIQADGAEDRLTRVAARIREWQPEALVVGVPFHPDGAEHENTRRARKFARSLRGRFGLPVYEVDERYSSTEAIAQGARDVDAGAACIILNQFLDAL